MFFAFRAPYTFVGPFHSSDAAWQWAVANWGGRTNEWKIVRAITVAEMKPSAEIKRLDEAERRDTERRGDDYWKRGEMGG